MDRISKTSCLFGRCSGCDSALPSGGTPACNLLPLPEEQQTSTVTPQSRAINRRPSSLEILTDLKGLNGKRKKKNIKKEANLCHYAGGQS